MLVDGHNRIIDYLRVSVTERCNFRCRYCMPEEGVKAAAHGDILSFEEMFAFIKICLDNGVKKVRLTGGEPLVRRGVEHLIKMINDYNPNLDLAMTTNGFYLPKMAKILRGAGLKRLNISLDTLNAKKAAFIARREVLDEVLKGIEAAKNEGFGIKLNTVAMRGVNDDELIDLLEFAAKTDAQIRFIEFMENTHASGVAGMKKDDILAVLGKKYEIKEITKSPNSPSALFEIANSVGTGDADLAGYTFGIIDPHKHDFCASCNRIRLSAEGLLIPCLYYEDAQSIKEAMRQKDIDRACAILNDVLANKPEKNRWENSGGEISNRAFYQTGG